MLQIALMLLLQGGQPHQVSVEYIQLFIMVISVVTPVAMGFLSLKVLSSSNALKLDIQKELEKVFIQLSSFERQVFEKLGASQLSFGLLSQQVQSIEKRQQELEADFKAVRRRFHELNNALTMYLLQLRGSGGKHQSVDDPVLRSALEKLASSGKSSEEE